MTQKRRTMGSKPNFSKAYIAANELLACENKLNSFPFSMRQLLKETTDVNMYSYQMAKEKYELDMSLWGSESAVIHEFNGRTVIFYNAKNSRAHVIYSIAHELGHYQLGHYANIDLADDDYNRQEVEANFFAAQLLMPDQLINTFSDNGIDITVPFLVDTFGVSNSAANKRIETISKSIAEYRNNAEKMFDFAIDAKYKDFVNRIILTTNGNK